MRNRGDVVDIHVGSRLRQLRQKLALSQEGLGEAAGISFQQIQKYENGANRIGASRLFEFARILDVSIETFFEGLPRYLPPHPSQDWGDWEQLGIFANSTEGKALLEAFAAISDAKARRSILKLLQALLSE